MSYLQPFNTNYTLIGQGYAGQGGVASTSPNFPSVQLWNPSSNTRQLIISSVIVSTPGTSVTVIMGFNTTQQSGTSNVGLNRLAGGSPSIAVIMQSTITATPGAPYLVANTLTDTATPFDFLDDSEVIVVKPGFGLYVVSVVAGSTINPTFKWVEM